MSQTTTGIACQRGHCTNAATAVVHVDYPRNQFTGGAPFRWSKPMCDGCRAIEDAGTPFNGTHVSTTPLPVTLTGSWEVSA